jgi:hypothetical protein
MSAPVLQGIREAKLRRICPYIRNEVSSLFLVHTFANRVESSERANDAVTSVTQLRIIPSFFSSIKMGGSFHPSACPTVHSNVLLLKLRYRIRQNLVYAVSILYMYTDYV